MQGSVWTMAARQPATQQALMAIASAALYRSCRIAAPFAPAAGKQGAVAQPGQFHGQHIGGGRHAATAVVHHALWRAPGQQGIELGAQYGCALEVAVGREIVCEWAIQGPWNVSGHRVTQLDLAPVTQRVARVKRGLLRLV